MIAFVLQVKGAFLSHFLPHFLLPHSRLSPGAKMSVASPSYTFQKHLKIPNKPSGFLNDVA